MPYREEPYPYREELLIRAVDRLLASESYRNQPRDSLNEIRNSEAFLSGQINLRDMIATSQAGGLRYFPVLLASLARQVAENPPSSQELSNIVDRVLGVAPRPAAFAHLHGHGSIGFFNNPQTHALPAIQRPQVTNAMKLDTAGYAGEIEPEFICPITNEIMDDPVNIPGSTNSFERAALHRWLNIRATNPLNPAQAITPSDIETATELHNRINEFITSISPPPPGPPHHLL